MNKSYTANNLLTLIEIANEAEKTTGKKVDYSMGEKISHVYNSITGENRNGGAIYMACWRIKEGFYDDRFPEVAIKRQLLN